MTADRDDPLLRSLRRVRVHEPDAARTERTRARCLAQMRPRAQDDDGSRRVGSRAASALEPVLVGGLCVGYLVAIIYDVVRLSGLALDGH